MQQDNKTTAATLPRARKTAEASTLRRIVLPVLVFAILLFALLAIISLFNIGPTGWPGRTSVLCCDTPGGSPP